MAKNKHILKYHQVDAYIQTVQPADTPALFFIHGEPYLIKNAFHTISSFLLGNDSSKFALEILEGGSVSMGDIIEQVSTFSFLVGKKIVAVKNIPLFQAQLPNQDITFSPAELDLFAEFIQGRIPDDHFLILTSVPVDKRKKIYKKIEEYGLVIDCSVAQGARKADLDEQRNVLQSVAAQILVKSQKTIEPRALNALVDLTGFNLDLFCRNLEKLTAYSGKHQIISLSDVNAVIIRDKKDPIFNLTNAFLEKDIKKSLFYLNSLFNEGYHSLQILKSFENLVRKLILVKCVADRISKKHSLNPARMNFNTFTQTMLPLIVDHDNQTKKAIEDQDQYLSSEGAARKTNKANDLFLAPNPKNAYPVFQVFQKSVNFSLNELYHALIFLSDLDYKLKSSSLDAQTQIESFIINICRKGEFVHDT